MSKWVLMKKISRKFITTNGTIHAVLEQCGIKISKMLREKYIPIILQINVVNLCFTIRRAQFFPLAEWSFFRNYLPIKLHPLGKNTSALIQCTPPFKIDAWNCIMPGMRETPSQFMSPNIHFDLQSKKNWWYGSQNAIFFTIKCNIKLKANLSFVKSDIS